MKKTKRILKKFGLNALVWREGDLFVAKSVEVLVASQGKTVQLAIKNLEEALELYFEDEKIPAEKITLFPSLRLEKLFPKSYRRLSFPIIKKLPPERIFQF